MTACLGQPVLVQLPLVPSYALTVHKTQARVNYNESAVVYALYAGVYVKTASKRYHRIVRRAAYRNIHGNIDPT